MRIVPLALGLLIAVASCKSKYRKAAEEIAAGMPSGRSTMNVGTAGYDLYVPPGWTTRRTTAYGINYYFLSAPATADDPNTSMNLITESMQGMSLEVYVDRSIVGLRRAIPSARILSRDTISANGLEGRWYSFEMEQQGIRSSLVSYLFPHKGVAYVLTGGTQSGFAAVHRGVFDSIARSIRFKD